MRNIKTERIAKDTEVFGGRSILRGSMRQSLIGTKTIFRFMESQSDKDDSRSEPDIAVSSITDNAVTTSEEIISKASSEVRKVQEKSYERRRERNLYSGSSNTETVQKTNNKTDDRIRSLKNKDVNVRELDRAHTHQRKTIKTVKDSGEAVQSATEFAVRTVQRMPEFINKTVSVIEKTVMAVEAVLIKMAAAIRSAETLLRISVFAGGAVSIIVITVICMAGCIILSPFGIFLSGEDTGNTKPMQQVAMEINQEFGDRINEIKENVEYDDIRISGQMSSWPDILAIYAVKTTLGTSPLEVVTITPEKEQLLRDVFWDMNHVSYTTEEYTDQIPVETDQSELIEEPSYEEVTRTRLLIAISRKTASEKSIEEGFTENQKKLLSELQSPQYQPLWNNLIGGYSAGMGIIPSEATWVGIGNFIWPLPINGTITSGFGYRVDPFTGEQRFHGGVDIAAPEGTPIIAADGGTVTVANGSDSWGGGYGYYVKIDHGNEYETLYGHCLSICVVAGQSVQRGEVIAYVGSTGNSTGNHLHFEIIINGNKTDALAMFN